MTTDRSGLLLLIWGSSRRQHAAKDAKKGEGGAAAAKARAVAAAQRVKNSRRDARRAALVVLNAIAEEVGAAAAQLETRSASAASVEQAIHVLEPRCQQPALAARLRAAVSSWVDNGGQLQAALADPPDLSTASALPKHRVLQPEFRLRSRAFMLTYNSRGLRPDSWQPFRTFVSNLKGHIGARARVDPFALGSDSSGQGMA